MLKTKLGGNGTMKIFLLLFLLSVGFVMLVKGADWFVSGASSLAQRFGISQLVIGMTIVAIGTSAPEAAVSIAAALKGSADITIGNIVGSNILNVLIILGISAVITPLAVSKSTLRYEVPFMIMVTLLLLAQGRDGEIQFMDGFVLLVFFLLYLFYLYCIAKKGSEPGEVPVKSQGMKSSIFAVTAGLVLILLGSNLSVDAASAIARMLGISERFIGLTIVALGTSLPELFTSVSAARKGNADIAIGNIVGSNIFNILFVVGLSAWIIPVPFSSGFLADTLTAAAAGILLLICSAGGQKLGRGSGILMLLFYLGYFVLICV